MNYLYLCKIIISSFPKEVLREIGAKKHIIKE